MNEEFFNRRISSVAPIKSASESKITFVTDSKHKASLANSHAGAVIVNKSKEGLNIPQLIVPDVNKALVEVLKIFAPKLKSQTLVFIRLRLLQKVQKLEKMYQ